MARIKLNIRREDEMLNDDFVNSMLGDLKKDEPSDNDLPDTSIIEESSFRTSKRFLRFLDENMDKLADYIRSHWVAFDKEKNEVSNIGTNSRQVVMKFYRDMLMATFMQEHHNIVKDVLDDEHISSMELLAFRQNPLKLCLSPDVSPIWYVDVMITNTLAKKQQDAMFQYIESSVGSGYEGKYDGTKFGELIDKVFTETANNEFAYIPKILWRTLCKEDVMSEMFMRIFSDECYKIVRDNILTHKDITDSSWLTASRLDSPGAIHKLMLDVGENLRVAVEEETFVIMSVTDNESTVFDLVRDVPLSVQKRIFMNILNNYEGDKNDPVMKLKNYGDVMNTCGRDAAMAAMLRYAMKGDEDDYSGFIKKVIKPSINILHDKFNDVFYSQEKKQTYAELLEARQKQRYADIEAIDITGSESLRVIHDLYTVTNQLNDDIAEYKRTIDELTQRLEVAESHNKTVRVDTDDAVKTAVDKALIRQSKESKKHEREFTKLIKSLEKENKKLNEKYEQLQEYTDMLMKASEIEAEQNEADIDIDLPDEIRNKRIVFVRDKEHAGYIVMQQIADYFPNARFSNGVASEVSNKTTDMVILLTKYTCHGTYWSARDRSRSKKVPTLHCAWSRLANIKGTIKEYWDSKQS